MNATHQNRFRRSQKGGMTLVEILVAMAVFTILMAMLMRFFTTSFESLFENDQRNLINRDIREVTQQLAQDARNAHAFYIYESADPADIGEGLNVQDGGSGDMLLLAWKTLDPDWLGQNPRKLTYKLVAYYRDPAAGNEENPGPVFRSELSFASDLSQTYNVINAGQPDESKEPFTPYELLEDYGATDESWKDEARQVVQLTRGMTDGQLFYNFFGQAVVINAQILHGNDAKWVTDTYNFSISPRG